MATLRVNTQAIRIFMTDRGWSERELAQQMHLAYSYVNRILAGKRQPGAKFVASALLIGLTMQEAFIIEQDDWEK
ncbi:MAG: helix-turn-helix transcriptional regulator [Firmicutes bacterium]|nr:helix-turn-helix transcriptional regulator [Bacillota bacterium]